ncbi:DUF6660 family protein [Daejeonella sp.]|uniref:DUF6660 family protein n=1 Tax=Daejeonella sp. TaxID=2805397 RepID=UPI00351F91FA
MKFWSRIVCTIVMLVSLVPCADAISYKSTSTIKEVFIEASSAQSHNERGLDVCSPFCVCACCNAPTIMKHAIFSINIPLQISLEYPNKTLGKATSTSISIWQPPRLG